MWRETKILLIDDDSVRRRDLAVILNFLGEENLPCGSHDWQQAVSSLSSSREIICVLIGTVNAPGAVLGLLKTLSTWDEFLPVLLMGDISSLDLPEDQRRRVLSALEMPPSYSKLLDSLHRAQVYREMYDQARERGRHREPNLFRSLVGTSRAIQHVRQMMQQVADTDASVLILGESGTGKEVVARNLHYHSKRRDGPFVPVNCGAIPAELLESELFGHEKGAFTGAITSRAGRFELANGGTLFLDEIGELPLEAQARLLRVLQEGEIRRVGSVQSQKVDVRLIAATHRDLKSLAKIGQFREDLYYRLHVIALKLPALRERGADVNEIANAFLLRQSARINRTDLRFAADAEQAIRHYSWPGNVRELENAVERAVILSESPEISAELLGIDIELSDLEDDDFIGLAPQQGAAGNTSHEPTEDLSLEDYFQHFVLEHQDHMTETELARKLGVSRKCLWERRQRLGIPRRKTGVASES